MHSIEHGTGPKNLGELERMLAQENVLSQQGETAFTLFQNRLKDFEDQPEFINAVFPLIVPIDKLWDHTEMVLLVHGNWMDFISLDPDINPVLAASAPNLTIGWKPRIIGNFENDIPPGTKHPSCRVAWPLFIVYVSDSTCVLPGS